MNLKWKTLLWVSQLHQRTKSMKKKAKNLLAYFEHISKGGPGSNLIDLV